MAPEDKPIREMDDYDLDWAVACILDPEAKIKRSSSCGYEVSDPAMTVMLMKDLGGPGRWKEAFDLIFQRLYTDHCYCHENPLGRAVAEAWLLKKRT